MVLNLTQHVPQCLSTLHSATCKLLLCTRIEAMLIVVTRDRYTGHEDGSLLKHTFVQHEEGYDPFTGQKGWKRLKKALSQDRRWSGVAQPSYSPDGLYAAVLVRCASMKILDTHL